LSKESLESTGVGIPDVLSKDSSLPKGTLRWKLPNVLRTHANRRFVVKANKFLRYKENRLNLLIDNGKIKKATWEFMGLIQSSRSFRVYCLNKTIRNWYWGSSYDLIESFMTKVDRMTSRLDTNPSYHRKYIPKTDGRFRPLGVPSVPVRVLNTMITEFLTKVIISSIGDNQFGFMENRNILQAWNRVVVGAKQGLNMFEFDLDGCFNRISLRKVLMLLKAKGIPSEFMEYLERYLSMMPEVNLNELQIENEVMMPVARKNILAKGGLPQGFSMSPILAIFVISEAFKACKLDPILYADDGILLTKTQTNPFDRKRLKILAEFGIYLSTKLKKDNTKACKFTKVLSFLGITRCSETDRILVDGKWVSRNLVDKKTLLKLTKDGYSIKTVVKPWNIVKSSYMYINSNTWTWENFSMGILWLRGKPQIMRKGLTFFNWIHESSKCCGHLLTQRMAGSSRKFKKIKLNKKFPFYGEAKRMTFGITKIFIRIRIVFMSLFRGLPLLR
jgi:hypothetical protein